MKKKLHEASSNIGDASKKSRTIESRLRSVEELPSGEAERLLPELGSEESEE